LDNSVLWESYFENNLPSVSTFAITVEISSTLGEYPSEFINERISELDIFPSPSLSNKENDSSNTKKKKIVETLDIKNSLPAICSSENPCTSPNSLRLLPVVV
jgi:hypothetical protein